MILSGTTIAPGIAFGPAVLWTPANEPVPRREIPKAAVAAEGLRLEHALRRARQELEQVAVRSGNHRRHVGRGDLPGA